MKQYLRALMKTDRSSSVRRGSLLKEYLFFLCAVMVLSLRMSPLCVEFAGDQAIYLTGARTILQGQLLYVHLWDNKPPLLFLIYAVAELLGGSWAYWGMTACVFAGALVALRRSLLSLFPALVSWCACGGILLFSQFMFFHGFHTPEQWCLICSCIVAALLLRSKGGAGLWLAAGGLAGAMFFIKPTTVMFPLAWGLVCLTAALVRRDSVLLFKTVLYAMAAAGSSLFGLLLVWRSGVFPEFWQIIVGFNREYARCSIESAGWMRHISNFVEMSVQNGICILWGCAIGAGILLYKKGTPRQLLLYWVCALALFLNAGVVFMTGRPSGFYFLEALLPAGICFGIVFSQLVQEVGRRRAFVYFLPALMPFFTLIVYWNLMQGAGKGTLSLLNPSFVKATPQNNPVLRLMADEPEGDVFLWDEIPSQYYYLTGRTPPSRFSHSIPCWIPSIYQHDYLQELVDTLQKNPPRLIVDMVAGGSLPGNQDFVFPPYYRISADELRPFRTFLVNHYALGTNASGLIVYRYRGDRDL